MTKTDARFVSTTKEAISEFQQASRNVNTDKSKNVWMSLFMKFRELRNYSNEIIDLDNKTLSDQLEQFIVEIRKSNGQEYKAPSLYTGFCALARGISEIFEEIQVINLFDKYQFKSLHRTLDGRMKSLVNDGDKNRKQSSPLEIDEIKFILNSPAVAVDNPKGLMRRVWFWLTLLCCLRGGDAKRLKASWLKELDDDGIRLELPKEKNHAGGIKDPYAESGNSLIPPDIPGNIYTPVADIRKYLSKRPNNAEDDYFFVGINTPKKVYHGDWYLTSRLGKGSHDTMMHSICKDAKLDFKGRCITNHSMRSTGIHNLVELGVTLDEQMIFSRHKTIAGVSAYQHQSLKRIRNNVSLLIPIEEAGKIP
ncbi:zinc finger mym-type protein 2-like: PROVISIONAL [Gigaspora margarita]|uniref:Zinc finger mym-type protein 2-like: PROVISIONAL n=1 Tax=Gigaspora margarita TaxID=4874 RepID=A0A8H3WSI6_GIGMA|nr:zinc finger mym-type protein 2-like: PROVISIONAL [Gigaspora margarita]